MPLGLLKTIRRFGRETIIKIPFVGGAYEGRSSNVSPENCINLFYEKGVSGESLVGTAGSTVHVTPTFGEGVKINSAQPLLSVYH